MERFRSDGGEIVGALEAEERALLRQLPSLVGSVGAVADDPALDRMQPDAYEDDEDAAWDFRRMTEPELDQVRTYDRELFEATLDLTSSDLRLSFDEAEAWVRLIGDARLIVAARAGVARDAELPEPSGSTPEITLVHYLGMIQDDLVNALSEGMQDQ